MGSLASREVPIGKVLKMALFTVLLIAASWFFGLWCGRVGQAYTLFFQPGREILTLVLWLLLAMVVVAVTAGLVAALLRPLWVAVVAFALSALAMIFGWQVGIGPALFGLLYFVASLLYTRGVAGELNDRLRFSVEPVSRGFSLLFMALALVACGSLYLGYAAHIEKEGFTFPPAFKEMMTKMTIIPMREAIEARTDLTPQEKERALAEIEEGFEEMWMEPLEEMIRPYERFIPAAVAVGTFMTLETILGLLSWIPGLILAMIFLLLRITSITKVVTETREVERLTIA
ncbi:MAG: hypothetical protein ACE5LG_06610 [Anaerolineae bacterium]